ncbi:hypothetical protein ACJDU8_24505 [Clostridium sp. WILCCON 0269]|uniref:DUF4393 domain-containing protein n=1 Tax=Candidatus Clostridium eludens TaxID=3381663 RepID=A0ABW8SU21_9CLOT
MNEFNEDLQGLGGAIIETTQYMLDKDIKNAVEDIVCFLGNYSEEIKILGEVSTIAKLGFSIYKSVSQRKYKAFLIKYANTVNNKEIKENIIKKLGSYLKKNKNIEFIQETIDSAINAKSIRCAGILGCYSGIIISKSKELEYKDYAIINALRIMIDKDLSNFVKLYDYIVANKMADEIIRTYDINNELESHLQVNIFELEQTIEKLKNIQLFSFSIGGYGDSGNSWGTFKVNDNTTYLYEIIRNSNIENIGE